MDEGEEERKGKMGDETSYRIRGGRAVFLEGIYPFRLPSAERPGAG